MASKSHNSSKSASVMSANEISMEEFGKTSKTVDKTLSFEKIKNQISDQRENLSGIKLLIENVDAFIAVEQNERRKEKLEEKLAKLKILKTTTLSNIEKLKTLKSVLPRPTLTSKISSFFGLSRGIRKNRSHNKHKTIRKRRHVKKTKNTHNKKNNKKTRKH